MPGSIGGGIVDIVLYSTIFILDIVADCLPQTIVSIIIEPTVLVMFTLLLPCTACCARYCCNRSKCFRAMEVLYWIAYGIGLSLAIAATFIDYVTYFRYGGCYYDEYGYYYCFAGLNISSGIMALVIAVFSGIVMIQTRLRSVERIGDDGTAIFPTV